MSRPLRLLVAEPRSAVSAPHPAAAPVIFDWQADEDGPLTSYDLDTALAVLDAHPATCVRDAGRKLRHFTSRTAR